MKRSVAASARAKMAEEHVKAPRLAELLGVDARSIDNFADEGMPKTGRGAYPLLRCLRWYINRQVDKARSSKGLNDLDRARVRKTNAEAERAELDLAIARGELVPLAELEAKVGEICDRIRAVILNLPANYGITLEASGLAPAIAEAALEKVGEELTAAIRGIADEQDTIANAIDAGDVQPSDSHPAEQLVS